MRLRGVAAVAHARLLHLTRSPIAFVVCVAFVLLVASLADVGAPSRAEQIRQASSWLVSAATALLLLSAVLIPVVGGAPRTRMHESRILGSRATNLGHAIAGLLFLVFLSGLIALASLCWIALEFKKVDVPSGSPIVRSVVYKNAAAFVLRPGESWSSGGIALGPHAGALHVELAPRTRFPEPSATESGSASGPATAWLELSWRAGARPRTRRFPLSGAQPIVETIELAEPGTRDAPLRVDLELSGRGFEVVFGRGDVTLLGVRKALLPGLMRSFLVVAFLASVMSVAAQWFSNFVGPLIAISAALTLMIVALAVQAIAPDLLQGEAWSAILPTDPAAALRRGHETAWPDVGRAFLASFAAIGFGALMAVHGSREADA